MDVRAFHSPGAASLPGIGEMAAKAPTGNYPLPMGELILLNGDTGAYIRPPLLTYPPPRILSSLQQEGETVPGKPSSLSAVSFPCFPLPLYGPDKLEYTPYFYPTANSPIDGNPEAAKERVLENGRVGTSSWMPGKSKSMATQFFQEEEIQINKGTSASAVFADQSMEPVERLDVIDKIDRITSDEDLKKIFHSRFVNQWRYNISSTVLQDRRTSSLFNSSSESKREHIIARLLHDRSVKSSDSFEFRSRYNWDEKALHWQKIWVEKLQQLQEKHRKQKALIQTLNIQCDELPRVCFEMLMESKMAERGIAEYEILMEEQEFGRRDFITQCQLELARMEQNAYQMQQHLLRKSEKLTEDFQIKLESYKQKNQTLQQQVEQLRHQKNNPTTRKIPPSMRCPPFSLNRKRTHHIRSLSLTTTEKSLSKRRRKKITSSIRTGVHSVHLSPTLKQEGVGENCTVMFHANNLQKENAAGLTQLDSPPTRLSSMRRSPLKTWNRCYSPQESTQKRGIASQRDRKSPPIVCPEGEVVPSDSLSPLIEATAIPFHKGKETLEKAAAISDTGGVPKMGVGKVDVKQDLSTLIEKSILDEQQIWPCETLEEGRPSNVSAECENAVDGSPCHTDPKNPRKIANTSLPKSLILQLPPTKRQKEAQSCGEKNPCISLPLAIPLIREASSQEGNPKMRSQSDEFGFPSASLGEGMPSVGGLIESEGKQAPLMESEYASEEEEQDGNEIDSVVDSPESGGNSNDESSGDASSPVSSLGSEDGEVLPLLSLSRESEKPYTSPQGNSATPSPGILMNRSKFYPWLEAATTAGTKEVKGMPQVSDSPLCGYLGDKRGQIDVYVNQRHELHGAQQRTLKFLQKGIKMGGYSHILKEIAKSPLYTPLLMEQLLWLNETNPDRSLEPPSQDITRDGLAYTVCIRVEIRFRQLLESHLMRLRKCVRKNVLIPEKTVDWMRASILKANEELFELTHRLDLGRYNLMKKLKLYWAEINSKWNGFPPLKRGYRLLNMLGKGGFAEVWEVFDPLTCKVFAAKLHMLSKDMDQKERKEVIKRVKNEIDIHKVCRSHNNVVDMTACFQMDENLLATILELCDDGDLDKYIKTYGPVPERLASIWTKQILDGLCHMKNLPEGKVHHCDLKPGNILRHCGIVKLADFGLSKIVKNECAPVWTGGGTVWYQPPECIKASRNSHILLTDKIDIWAIGCILFEMLYARRPFGHSQSNHRLAEKLLNEAYAGIKFPSCPDISNECKSFLQHLLNFEADKRPSIEEAMAHSFVKNAENYSIDLDFLT